MSKEILLAKGTTIKVEVKVKSKKDKLPDWGLGPGILAKQEFVIGEDVIEDNKIHFYLKRDEIYQNLLKHTLEAKYTIVDK